MNLPNAITLLRILLVPVFAWLVVTERPVAASIVFVIAAVSDGIDGFLARLLRQHTELGAILDPIADKFLALTALILLVSAGAMPMWLLGVALLRDVVVFGTGVTAKLRRRAIAAEPTRISKYGTFTLMASIALGLFARSSERAEELLPFVAVLGVVAAECLLVASVQYGLRWRGLLAR